MTENQAMVQVTDDQTSISQHFGYTPQEVAVIQNSVAKGTSKVELAYFINVCKTVGLNPFVKEIWCYKDKQGNLLVFAGRDGFLAKAQRHPSFKGIRSSDVCENDKFSIDIANNKIEHSFGIGERGKIVGAYAIAFRKDGEPTIEYADFKSYDKGFNAWRTHPAEMIKKTAETHALKKCFGISGIQSEYDYDVKDNVAMPVNTTVQADDSILTELISLYEEKKHALNEDETKACQRIIDKQESKQYNRMLDFLNTK